VEVEVDEDGNEIEGTEKVLREIPKNKKEEKKKKKKTMVGYLGAKVREATDDIYDTRDKLHWTSRLAFEYGYIVAWCLSFIAFLGVFETIFKISCTMCRCFMGELNSKKRSKLKPEYEKLSKHSSMLPRLIAGCVPIMGQLIMDGNDVLELDVFKPIAWIIQWWDKRNEAANKRHEEAVREREAAAGGGDKKKAETKSQ